MRRLLFILLAAAIILYLIPLLLVFMFQRSLLYFPPGDYFPPAALDLAEAQEIRLEGPDGELTAWWLAPQTDKPVILFFHGNGSAVYSNHDIYRDLHQAGYGILGVGYPGYPGSAGKPNQPDIVDAAVIQYDWLTGQGINPNRIVFFGTSLGSGVAAQLAARRGPAMIIMEAPFNSVLDMGKMTMPVFPVGWLLRDSYRSDLALADKSVPLVWVHGTRDGVIPVSQGQKLYESFDGPKSKLIIEGGQHTNLWGLGGREFVLAELQALILE